MSRFLTLAAGRRAKWIVAGIWLVVFLVTIGANLPGKFADNEKNESSSFLPAGVESTKELTQSEHLQQGEQAPIVIVYRRESGLTAADRARIASNRAALNAKHLPKTSPFAPPVLSRDGK